MSNVLAPHIPGAYDNDGAVIVRDVLPSSWIDRMRRAIDHVIAEPSAAGRDDAADTGQGGKFVSDFFGRVTPETGVVTYVAGSRLWGKMYRPKSFGAPSALHEQNEGMEEVPDIDARPQDCRFVTGVLEPGDVFIHHARTLHGAPGNSPAGTRRRALATRWTGDDARYHGKPGSFLRTPRYEHATRLLNLKDGDPLVSELFPAVLPS